LTALEGESAMVGARVTSELLMAWKLATRDVERYRIYFPAVELIEPATAS